LAALLMIIAIPDAHTGIAGLLIVNLSAAAALLSLRAAFTLSGAASGALMLLSVFDVFAQNSPVRLLLEALLFAFTYIAAAWLNHTLGRQMRASEALAERRGLDLANLAQVNELIIKRMKTGVLLVDAGNHIHQMNESAWLLLGNPAASSATWAAWPPSCRGACTTGAIWGAWTKPPWRWPRACPRWCRASRAWPPTTTRTR
ncbi:two-component system, sensor protein, partial [mine drainage metagenome]